MAKLIIPPPQAGEYNFILADFPWDHKAWSAKGEMKGPKAHYDTMTLDEIAALPIGDWASRNCALAMWITWPMIEQIMSPRIKETEDGLTIFPRIYECWGFKFSGLLWEWRKYNPATDKYAFGGGYGSRKNLEPCLLLRRGHPPVFNRSQRDFIDGGGATDIEAREFWRLLEAGELSQDWLDAKRREHSRKPDEQYDRIEAMFDGPYLEIFATQQRDGWDIWAPQAHQFREYGQPDKQEADVE